MMPSDPRSTTTPPASPTSPDCDRFRGRLSAYLDGMLEGPDRDAADTHVAACSECRRLADEAEASERLLARGLDETADAPLPEGFMGAVLARTVHEAPVVAGRVRAGQAAHGSGLVPWLGWLAAAAMVAFNVTLWNVGPASSGTSPATSTDPPPTVLASGSSAPWQVSSTRTGPASGSVAPSIGNEADLRALHAAATILETFVEAAPADAATVAVFARQVIAYDRLVERLGAIARTLPSESSATVETTRGHLQALLDGGDAAARTLHRRLAPGNLPAALRRIEERVSAAR